MSAKKRKGGFGSTASLRLTNNDEFELSDVMKARSPSTHSRTAWIDDEFLNSEPGVDEVDFSPRQPPIVQEIAPMGMDAQSEKQLTNSAKTTTVHETIPVGCGTSFRRIVRSLWRTRQTEDTKVDRELHIRTTLRELIIYLIFLIVLCILTFGMTNSNMYFYTKVMRDLFVETQIGNTTNTLKTVSTQKLFWDYALDPMVEGLYWEQYYNKENVSDEDLGFIYFENKILGRPRLRQLRVTNKSCTIHKNFKSQIKQCYAMYSTNIEEKTPFGLQNGTAWTYQSEEQLQSIPYWGQITTYGGGGYTQLLSERKKDTVKILEKLKAHRWLDRGTRAVSVDFTVYNANINLFCIIRLFFEFPATGGCIPSFTFRVLKLIRYVTTMDYFVMACESIFVLFIIYYSIEEVLEISKHKVKYFYSFWNVLDVIVLVLGYMCIIYNIWRTVEVDILLGNLLQKQEQYANFDALGFYQTQFNNVLAIAIFFAWIKVFKYISFNKTMTQLSSTLSKCAKDVAGFAIMFFIIFFAYAQLGYLLFGTQVADFSSFEDSIFTLFRIILGDFDFHQIEDANRVLGPAFFITYVFFVFFVLLNMFLAIINDTYAEVKSDIASQRSEFEITDYLKKGYQKMLDKLSFKREKIIDIQKALKSADVNQDNKLDFEELRADLKFRGHADAEIEAVFAKYDLDGDRILNEEEQKRMQEDLEGQKAELNEEIEDINRAKEEMVQNSDVDSDDDTTSTVLGGRADSPTARHLGAGVGKRPVSKEEFNMLTRRVDRLEHSIGSIVSKIDAVLVKLETMEKAKHKRRETMAKLLQSITEGDGREDSDDAVKERVQMEKLVREELERWDSESNRDSDRSLPSSRASTAMSLTPRRPTRNRDRSPSHGSAFQEPQSIPAVFNEHSNV